MKQTLKQTLEEKKDYQKKLWGRKRRNRVGSWLGTKTKQEIEQETGHELGWRKHNKEERKIEEVGGVSRKWGVLCDEKKVSILLMGNSRMQHFGCSA